MNIQEFEDRFGTEKQCLDYLFRLRWPDGYRCPRCHHNEGWTINQERHKYKCKRCKYQATVTAGTLFQDAHITLNHWFRAIWYVTSQEQRSNALDLQRVLELGNYRTALMLSHRLRRAMKPPPEQLRGIVEFSIVETNDGTRITAVVDPALTPKTTSLVI